MFWVGLATLIMLISGTGDDTREFRKRVKVMHGAIEELVPNDDRRAAAQQALDATGRAFLDHRARLDEMSQCIGKADASYHATTEVYSACLRQLDEVWKESTAQFLSAEENFRAALTPQELAGVQEKLAGVQEKVVQ